MKPADFNPRCPFPSALEEGFIAVFVIVSSAPLEDPAPVEVAAAMLLFLVCAPEGGGERTGIDDAVVEVCLFLFANELAVGAKRREVLATLLDAAFAFVLGGCDGAVGSVAARVAVVLCVPILPTPDGRVLVLPARAPTKEACAEVTREFAVLLPPETFRVGTPCATVGAGDFERATDAAVGLLKLLSPALTPTDDFTVLVVPEVGLDGTATDLFHRVLGFD